MISLFLVMMYHTLFFWLVVLFLASSCSLGPPYRFPFMDIPSKWKNKQACSGSGSGSCFADAEQVYLDHWWDVFGDEKLSELEQLVIENNRDLFMAYQRIQEARDRMGIAAANFYPQITLNPLTTNTVELIKNYVNPNAANSLSSSSMNGGAPVPPVPMTPSPKPFRAHEMLYLFPLNMSYEVDLWGKIRDQYQAAKYTWLATKKDYEALMLSLTATLATFYYQLRVADAQMEFLEKILHTRQKALEINQARYEEGVSFYADVTLVAEELDTILNQYREVYRQRKEWEDAIAVLIAVPASDFCLESMPLVGQPPCIPAGVPSEVILRRPDIAEAEDQTRSQHALVKEAYTHFFPSLVLTAAAGFESPTLKDFLTWISRYWSDSVQIDQLVFDGWKSYYDLKLQIDRFLETGGNYQQQVLVAFQEVEDALENLDSYAREYEVALLITQWGEKTHRLYSDRYESGVGYYIDVANTERDLLNQQLNVNVLLGFRYVATVQLIKALGGGWE